MSEAIGARRLLPSPPAVGAGAVRLTGLRLVIDAGHDGLDSTPTPPTMPGAASWALEVALRLAGICRAAGAAVALTRSTDAFVPRSCRRAHVRELRPDVALSLHLGPSRGRSGAVRFGRSWWQAANAGKLARPLAEALVSNLDVDILPAAGRRVGRCSGPGGRWRTLSLLMVVHPAADGAGLDAATWAEALAEGLARFHSALAWGTLAPSWTAGRAPRSTPSPAPAPYLERGPDHGPGPVPANHVGSEVGAPPPPARAADESAGPQAAGASGSGAPTPRAPAEAPHEAPEAPGTTEAEPAPPAGETAADPAPQPDAEDRDPPYASDPEGAPRTSPPPREAGEPPREGPATEPETAPPPSETTVQGKADGRPVPPQPPTWPRRTRRKVVGGFLG